MFLRKQFACRTAMDRTRKSLKIIETCRLYILLILLISLSTCFLSFYHLLQFSLIPLIPLSNNTHLSLPTTAGAAVCGGGRLPYVYIYDLPPEFNSGLLKNCAKLNVYTNMCPHVANDGLGQPLSAATDNWFATNQFMSEMMFDARLKNHPCRTFDPANAGLFYVPFYGGLYASSVFRELNHTARDELAVRFVDFLVKQPWWRRSHGGDHFLALGRTAWDFMRGNSGSDFGANCLLNLPPVKNMSVLTVERQPWNGRNQFGIPYPSYFHPSTEDEMATWQHKMKRSRRPYLFSFIGAPRNKKVEKAVVRNELIRQCNVSTRCMLLNCGSGGSSKCHSPREVVKVMSMSKFCLQAPGDSFTRRSTFDSVLAGCIPVFFSQHTAYTQYSWYFPADGSEYSVYIDERKTKKIVIEEELMKISREKVEKMRSRIIELMPRVTYAHPNATFVGFEDAVDVALAAMANHNHAHSYI